MKIPYGLLFALLGSSILIACGGGGSGGSSLASDTTRPTIIATSPALGATNISTNTPITVTFSEPMDLSTINDTTIYLGSSANNGIYPGIVTYAGTTANFTPNAFPLGYSSSYNIIVTSGVKDLAGNSLASNYSSGFTTVTGIPTPHQVTITWTANREAAVNRAGGGYKIAIAGQPLIDVPYPLPTSKVVTLMSGTYIATITAYSALSPYTGLVGTSASAPSSEFAIFVPYLN